MSKKNRKAGTRKGGISARVGHDGLGDPSTIRADAKKLSAVNEEGDIQKFVTIGGGLFQKEDDGYVKIDPDTQVDLRDGSRMIPRSFEESKQGKLLKAVVKDSLGDVLSDNRIRQDELQSEIDRISDLLKVDARKRQEAIDRPLLDKFWQQCNRDKTYRGYRKILQESVAFRIDESTVRKICDLATQDPEKVLSYLPAARAPYDVTWIELDLHRRAAYNYEIATDPSRPGPDTPYQMGHLIRCVTPTKYLIYTVVSENENNVGMGLMPIVHMVNLDDDGPPDQMLDVRGMASISEDLDFAVLLAKSMSWGWVSTDEEEVRLPKAANNHYNIGVDPVFIEGLRERKRSIHIESIIQSSIGECAGDIRWLICALAAINEVPTVTGREERTSGSFRGGGRMQPYLKHRTIELQIGRTMTLKKMHKLIGSAAKKRAHRVRRHVRVYHRGTAEEFSVWVEPHVRGDASLGWVHQDYEVTS